MKVPETPTSPLSATSAVSEMVADLVRSFREQVRRATGIELDDSITSLAFVDHYLKLARQETRPAVLLLLAVGAGAYYGELVRRHLGAQWLGDVDAPQRLQLVMQPQRIHFSPVDQALEVVLGAAAAEGLPGHQLDPVFHLLGATSGDPQPSDASWLDERMSSLAPVYEDEYYTLTCRYETLQYMLELLAGKHRAEGKLPRSYGVEDYIASFAALKR